MTTATQKSSAEYKLTEIGKVPADWDIVQLKNIAKYRRGSFPQPYGLSKWYDDASGAPFIQVFDVDENMRLKPETKRMISKEAQEMSVFVKKGSIVLTIQGSIGRIAITQYDAYVDRTLLLFESFLVPVDVYYFTYAVFALFEREKEKAPGGTIKTITKEKLSEFLLPLPSKIEQTAIASALSDIDTLIAKLQKFIEKKRDIKQGAMQELLTGKRRLPGFRNKWELKKLGEVADFDHGRNLPKSDLSDDGLYKCIHYGQLFTGYKELIRDVKSRTHESVGSFYSKANDVLMPTSDVTPRGLATASCIKEDGVILGGGILVIRLHSGYDGLYFSYFVSQNKNSVLRFVKGSTVFHLYANDLANFEVGFPELKEQIAIATVLSDMDVEIEKLESQLTKYQNIKQGMMQTLLTGKIRLLTK